MRRVLVTGATGFVGAAVVPALARAGWDVAASVRSAADAARLPSGARAVAVGGLSAATDWSAALDGVEAVAHLAALAHRPGDGPESEADYARVNADATGALARAAERAGARRLVFLSSVKAVGERSEPGRPLDENSPCAPGDAYGRSKLAAERALAETGLSWCALRAPLVYGPGVKANFLRLLKAVDRGLPLPLGAAANRRSLLYLGNLADAVVRLLDAPAARGPFMIRDAEDLTVAEFVRRLAAALGRPARLPRLPAAALRAGAALAGRGAEAGRLLDELVVDDARLRSALGWTPPFSVERGLADVARWYREGRA